MLLGYLKTRQTLHVVQAPAFCRPLELQSTKAKRISLYDFYCIDMSSAVANEITKGFQELQEKCKKYFPKVDPLLINSLLMHQLVNPSEEPIFMVEVFTKRGLNVG